MAINLQELIEKTIDFIWIDGSELHIPMPSTRFVKKVNRSENEFSRIYELTLSGLTAQNYIFQCRQLVLLIK